MIYTTRREPSFHTMELKRDGRRKKRERRGEEEGEGRGNRVARETGRQAPSIRREFTLSVVAETGAGNSENVVPGPRGRVGDQQAHCQKERRFRDREQGTRFTLGTAPRPSSPPRFLHLPALACGFGIVALIKPARVTGGDVTLPWFLTVHRLRPDDCCLSNPSRTHRVSIAGSNSARGAINLTISSWASGANCVYDFEKINRDMIHFFFDPTRDLSKVIELSTLSSIYLCIYVFFLLRSEYRVPREFWLNTRYSPATLQYQYCINTVSILSRLWSPRRGGALLHRLRPYED